MGFLMGAYGKLMAGQLVRDLQYQLTSVSRRVQRITREIGDKEKYYQAQERNMKQMMQSQQQMFLMGGLSIAANGGNALAAAQLSMMMGADPSSIYNSPEYSAAINNTVMANQFSTQIATLQQRAQMQATMANSMWQQVFEMQRDADLQSLKDIQDSLETEKLNLESRIKLAEADQQAYKDMEKADQKGFVPEYTGQG